MRLGLLASISWVMSLAKPVFTLWGLDLSWRDLILVGRGLFLLVKATTEIPEGRYHTAGGLVLATLARFPKVGDTVQWGGWTLEVAAMEGLGIRRLVARRTNAADAG